MIVGYQGAPGAFSDEAAHERFGDVERIGFHTFEQLFDAVDAGAVTRAVVPVENTICGTIVASAALLAQRSQIVEIATFRKRISQALIGLPGTALERLKRIASHPTAIAQCSTFLDALPNVRVEPVFDTAGAVCEMMERGDATCAAIASADTAARYGGVVLARAIQDVALNYTRFVVIVSALAMHDSSAAASSRTPRRISATSTAANPS